MAVNKSKVMLSFMREVNDGNIPSAKDYGLEPQVFYSIVEECQDKGYIKGANFAKGGRGNRVQIPYLDNVELTVEGLEYLKENSALMKTYKGLKELRDWLPL